MIGEVSAADLALGNRDGVISRVQQRAGKGEAFIGKGTIDSLAEGAVTSGRCGNKAGAGMWTWSGNEAGRIREVGAIHRHDQRSVIVRGESKVE